MPALAEIHTQAVTGVAPPQLSEAVIRDVWPSIASHPAAASFGRACNRSIIFAPIGWLALAPLYFRKLLAVIPLFSGFAVRYRLTNRRLMICKGFRCEPVNQVSLRAIKDVRVVTDANSDFYRSGTLEVLGDDGRVLLTLPGVREPESMRQHILQAAAAWGPMQPAA